MDHCSIIQGRSTALNPLMLRIPSLGSFIILELIENHTPGTRKYEQTSHSQRATNIL